LPCVANRSIINWLLLSINIWWRDVDGISSKFNDLDDFIWQTARYVVMGTCIHWLICIQILIIDISISRRTEFAKTLQKLRKNFAKTSGFLAFIFTKTANFNIILTLNMLFDTEFNSGHFKYKNVKIGWKPELLDWKEQKNRGFFCLRTLFDT
jgi:hypothetical protein